MSRLLALAAFAALLAAPVSAQTLSDCADGAPAAADLVTAWPTLPDGVTATLRDHVTVDLGATSVPASLAPLRQRTGGARFTLTLGGEPVAVESDAPAFVTEWLPPAPDPARGEAARRYTDVEAGPETVTVHDLLGRTAATLADGDAAAGPHAARLETCALAAGVVRMTAADFAGVQRLTAVR